MLVCTVTFVSAQNRHFDVDDFKKKKAEYIIKEVGLTDAEAKAFIPLSNELLDKRFEINHNIRSKNREIREKQTRTDADYTHMIESSFDLREKELQLEKEYYQKFRKVLSPEKIYKFQRAESKFMKETFNKNGQKGKPGRK
ncbi:MAG TPA: hypothetical protein DIT04_10425 [Dysgonomonas sp.]|nr:hypothetical protein [Dysgonomonas sp.]